MNLFDFAVFVRRAIIYLALGITAAVILYFLYKLAANIYLTLNPPPEPPPTVTEQCQPSRSGTQLTLIGRTVLIGQLVAHAGPRLTCRSEGLSTIADGGQDTRVAARD